MAIRAAEGIKRSTVLISYQNRMKTDDIGKGSAFDDLIRLADSCARELREKHPAVVDEFCAAAARAGAGQPAGHPSHVAGGGGGGGAVAGKKRAAGGDAEVEPAPAPG
jgi:hypothetical protein